MDFSHTYLLRFSWFISRSSVSGANPKTFLEQKGQAEMAACGAGPHPWLVLTATAPEEEGGPGSPFWFQHTKIFLVWKTPTASKKNIAPLPVHPNFGNLEFKFQFGIFFPQRQYFWQMWELLTSSSVANDL